MVKLGSVFTCTCKPECKHDNGWFHTVHFWIFKKEIYFCTDCNEFVPAEKIREPKYFYYGVV